MGCFIPRTPIIEIGTQFLTYFENALWRYANLHDVFGFAPRVSFLWDDFLQFCHQLIEPGRVFQAIFATLFPQVQQHQLGLMLSCAMENAKGAAARDSSLKSVG